MSHEQSLKWERLARPLAGMAVCMFYMYICDRWVVSHPSPRFFLISNNNLICPTPLLFSTGPRSL
jgi:hypothetical protein